MLEDCKSAQERWGGVHVIIDRWLEQRRVLIERMVTLRERGEFTPTDTPAIQVLCEQLVDYVSVGHFEVYEQLAIEAEAFHDDSALLKLKAVMPEIQESTEVAVEFNDKYDTKDHENEHFVALPFALQALTVVMAERFGLEDQLIKELHEAHSENMA